MKKFSILRINLVLLFSLTFNLAIGQTQTDNTQNQSDPSWVVNQLFEAANNGDYTILEKLCDPMEEGDGDTKTICGLASASEKVKTEFATYFKAGKIVGEPEINDNTASVPFKFGPNGERDETMNLVQREGLWYLSSF